MKKSQMDTLCNTLFKDRDLALTISEDGDEFEFLRLSNQERFTAREMVAGSPVKQLLKTLNTHLMEMETVEEDEEPTEESEVVDGDGEE